MLRHSASPRAYGRMFPCVSRDHLSVHSICYYFSIAFTGERGLSSDNNNGGDGTAASSPLTVCQLGEVSPEGEIVAAVRPGGKGRLAHPGVPPISGGRRRQQRRQKQLWKGGGGDKDKSAEAALEGPYRPSLEPTRY